MPKTTRILFEDNIDYMRLSDMLNNGAQIRSTNITEKFKMSDYNEKYYGRSVPLFAMTPKGRIYAFCAGNQPAPGPGWTIMSLVGISKEDKKMETESEREENINKK